ncbi:MAG: YggS family pyridoxal phosphate-dependent enzyme [Opitutales bacterium]
MVFEDFETRLTGLRDRLARACEAAGREPVSVRLLPVTKTHPATAAAAAFAAGLTAVGENRVQEAASKRPEAPAGLRWELIGHLQSNKARAAVETFDAIQSVDSAKLARKLNEAAADLRETPLPVLMQVNSGEDPGKFGCAVDDAPALLDAILACPHLRLDGLMAIAPLEQTEDSARRCFARLRELRDALGPRSGVPLHELSMGMSGDLEAAIAEGSTCIRIGSALFGAR